jgi:biopolymer transport protein ExbD
MRRRRQAEIDLIGFLDIISILIVLILLVISLMAINLGQTSTKNSTEESSPKTDNSDKGMPAIKITTSGGIPVTSRVTFLMCTKSRVDKFDPKTGRIQSSFSINDQGLRSKLLTGINTPRVYLAVKPSCFQNQEKVVNAIKLTGLEAGYEPIEESSRTPWSIDKPTR